MNDLLTELREFDLPPRWDGRAVWWAGWQPQLEHVFICPPRAVEKHVCTACGSTAAPVVNRGHVTRSAATSLERWVERCEAWSRLPPGARHLLPKHPSGVIELIAHRCPDCRHDLVWDMTTDEWWDLDHTDYGPDGSREPSGPA